MQNNTTAPNVRDVEKALKGARKLQASGGALLMRAPPEVLQYLIQVNNVYEEEKEEKEKIPKEVKYRETPDAFHRRFVKKHLYTFYF